MAITKLVNTLTDTHSKHRVVTTGLADGATELSSNVFVDVSALKYATTTLTLAAAPSTNFCIGETLTTNDGTPIFMVVQDYDAAATTVSVYKCTSATDPTPLGWASGVATGVGTGKTLTGSVSGLSSTTTHGSTALAITAKEVNLRHIWWDLASGITHCRIFFDGSGTEQTLMYLRGGSTGAWNLAEVFGSSLTMGAAAGNSSGVLGDLGVTTVGVASGDTYLIGLEIQKVSGFNLPNFEQNARLGYDAYRTGNH